MEKVKEIFVKYLDNYNLRMTSQRELLFDLFMNTEGHITADEFFVSAKALDATLGVATIYRFLKLMREAGIADEIIFGEGKVRYEKKFGTEHHDHLLCEQCGINIEFFNGEIENHQETIAQKYGFTLNRHKMILFGLCPDCRNNKN